MTGADARLRGWRIHEPSSATDTNTEKPAGGKGKAGKSSKRPEFDAKLVPLWTVEQGSKVNALAGSGTLTSGQCAPFYVADMSCDISAYRMRE